MTTFREILSQERIKQGGIPFWSIKDISSPTKREDEYIKYLLRREELGRYPEGIIVNKRWNLSLKREKVLQRMIKKGILVRKRCPFVNVSYTELRLNHEHPKVLAIKERRK